MDILILERTVGELHKERPALGQVFDTFGIDYRRGGDATLLEACNSKGVRPQELLDMIEDLEEESMESGGLRQLTLLADQIEGNHRGKLRGRLPGLEALTEKVARVHAASDPRLAEVRDLFTAISRDLVSHLENEEEILFPLIRLLETPKAMPVFHSRMLPVPIGRMVTEHGDIAALMGKLRFLTNGFAPPDWACDSYRAMLEGLAGLDADLRASIHMEGEILFPRAMAMENARRMTG